MIKASNIMKVSNTIKDWKPRTISMVSLSAQNSAIRPLLVNDVIVSRFAELENPSGWGAKF